MGLINEEAEIDNITIDGLDIDFDIITDKPVNQVEESNDVLSKRLLRLALELKESDGNYMKIMGLLHGLK